MGNNQAHDPMSSMHYLIMESFFGKITGQLVDRIEEEIKTDLVFSFRIQEEIENDLWLWGSEYD